MAALTAARNTPRLGGDISVYDHPMKASTKVFAGSLVARDSTGHLVPGSASTTQKAVGRCRETYDNSTGANAAITAAVDAGVFLWNNSAAADVITEAEVGDDCYIVDDQTVAKTDGTGSRSIAGKIVGITSTGVWVATKPAL